MKILTAEQTKILDRATIKEQYIQSIDLMERAAQAFTEWFLKLYYPSEFDEIAIFCGIGDNGGDGLAVGRMINTLTTYKVKLYIVRFSDKTSKDFEINLKRAKEIGLPIIDINKGDLLPNFNPKAIAIDAILGSGLNRPVSGFLEELVNRINETFETILSIDIASGTFADQHTSSPSILPTKTCSFELPKLAFLFPENDSRIGDWHIRSIQSSQETLDRLETSNHYLTLDFIKNIFKKRPKYAHKGTFGHSLLIAGSYGMMGAALLAAKACLRTGSGLVTLHVPQCGCEIVQTKLPEVIVSIDNDEKVFSGRRYLGDYNVIGVGCGLGKHKTTQSGLLKLVLNSKKNYVIDADALNIFAASGWHFRIPRGAVLTPHIKEFSRLFGKTENDFERLDLQRKKAKEYGITIVLKGAHTSICTPNGNCYFNSTGNPGMATAGSGDVLTGIITALISQGYSNENAAILGVYLHGWAGDLAAKAKSQTSMIASDIIDNLSNVFLELE